MDSWRGWGHTVRHVLIFDEDPDYAWLLTAICEGEGYTVTVTHTVDDALMVLRTTLHPLIVVTEYDYIILHTDGTFFQTIRDHPDLYGQHRYITLHWRTLSGEEVALLDGVSVLRISRPFQWQELIAILAHVARWIYSAPGTAAPRLAGNNTYCRVTRGMRTRGV